MNHLVHTTWETHRREAALLARDAERRAAHGSAVRALGLRAKARLWHRRIAVLTHTLLTELAPHHGMHTR